MIIGGSGGIGSETARVLSGNNIDVCLTYFNSYNKLREKLNDLKKFNLYQVDVRDENSCAKLISTVLQDHGTIDSIIYCVSGKIRHKAIYDLSWQEFQEHINIQIKGLFSIIKSLEPLIRDNKKIKFVVVLTEGCIGKPPALLSHYITAKYGLMGFVKSMASEIRSNCTFNMISPGMVETELLSDFPPKVIELAAYKHPMKRIAKPIDIARIISFLVSEDSDYLNGTNIPLNGGNIFN